MKDTKKILGYFSIILLIAVLFVVGILLGRGKGNFLNLPNTGEETQTTPTPTKPTINKEEFRIIFLDIIKSIEERDLQLFKENSSETLNNSLNENFALLKNELSVESIEDFFTIIAPDLLLYLPQPDLISVNKTTLALDNNSIVINFVNKETYTELCNATFVDENGWKFQSLLPKDALKVATPSQVADYEINFDPINGFSNKSLIIKKGETIKFTNLSGKIRTILNSPSHFASKELFNEDFYITPNSTGKYEYGIIYKNGKVLPMWGEDYLFFKGEFLVNE